MKTSFEIKIKNNMELIQPEKQDAWGIAAVINFILGGIATAFYLCVFLFNFFSGDSLDIFQHPSIRLIAPALVATGFIVLTFEAGRPLRSYQLFNNLHRSFMSIEVFAGSIFIFSIVLECTFSKSFFSILAAASALIFLISQGYILYQARAIVAWNVPIMPFASLVSNFTMASGFVLILTTQEKITLKINLFVIALICVILDTIIFYLYITLYSRSHFQKAIKILRKSFSKIFIVGVGNISSIFLLLFLLPMVLFNPSSKFLNAISVLTGIFIIVGGISQKFVITIGNDYLRGIEISQTQVK